MRKVRAALLLACCLCAPLPAHAQPVPVAAPQPRHLLLQQAIVAGSPQSETMWVFLNKNNGNNVVEQDCVYRTLASPGLRQWVSELPPGSVILWSMGGPYVGTVVAIGSPKGTKIDHHVKPGDMDMYGLGFTPDVQAQMQDFYHFCQSKHVTFQRVPGPYTYS